MSYDGLIFDLDGTLWDANSVYHLAWNKALEELGVPVKISKQQMDSVMGKGNKEVDAIFFSNYNEGEIKEIRCYIEKRQNEELLNRNPKLYPDVVSLIKKISELFPLFIVSNCDAFTIPAFLEISGLGNCFKQVAWYGTPHLSKAENIAHIITDYSLKFPLYIGDTLHDYEACKSIGVEFVQVLYGFGKPIENNNIKKINSIYELKHIITK